MPKSKDLFDDSTMSFGDHLEALRIHLFKSLIGVLITVTITLFWSAQIIEVIRRPIDQALRKYNSAQSEEFNAQAEQLQQKSFWEQAQDWWNGTGEPEPEVIDESTLPEDTIHVRIEKSDLKKLVLEIDPEAKLDFDPPPKENQEVEKANEPEATAKQKPRASSVTIPLRSNAFIDLRKTIETISKPITLNVQEAFMIYLKVALVSGVALAFPWIAYQLWLFVSAGLYAQEKRYVFVFLPISLGLFASGAVFCYYAVFPFVLKFLLGFNASLGVTPQIRLSEWISFAMVLPLMFGLSFQLPLVMYFIEKMGIITVQTFREKRRLAILIISTLSMFLTPADPMSMIMMMVPLIILYELGIIFCAMNPAQNPYAAEK